MLSRFFQGNAALSSVHGTSYTVGPHYDTIYAATGISIDWAYGVAGIKYSFLIELRDEGDFGFTLPADQILPTGEEVYAFHSTVAKEILAELDGER